MESLSGHADRAPQSGPSRVSTGDAAVHTRVDSHHAAVNVSARPLRLLLVEDSSDDAALLLHALSKGGYRVTSHRVETPEDMRAALATGDWDLVISDYSLPSFSGPDALQLLHEFDRDLPFIIISGTVGEETAVSALKAGAHDFLVKGRLARLVPAIERELRDVSARRERTRALRALRESEAKHRALIERAVFGICQATRDGRFLTVNPALVSMLGFESADALTQVSLASLYADDAARAAFLHDVRHNAQFSGQEALWQRQTGEPIRVRLSGRTIPAADGTESVLELIVEDTTERHRLEEQLRHAQKMEAIGHLAGGIAHDFNNLLTAILGYGGLVLEEVQDRPELASEVEEIVRAGERARNLTAQLLAFSRKQVVARRVLDLNETVVSVQKLLAHVIGKDIRLESRLGESLPPVKADPGQIEQVLMNLAVNARDAMPGGGALTLATAVTPLPADLRGGSSSDSDRYIALSVTDTGCGIPPDVRDRMFDPFFTTKAPGKGTGLGLSTVYGIVTQSGGQLTVESEVGAGTTFTIYLPAVDDAAEPALVEPLVARGLSGTETILLVEDDPAIRGLAQRILERCGYTVLTAHDGTSGEQAAIQHAGPIDLLVTDIRMPDVSGPNLAQRIVMRRHETKVLYMSGYAEDPARIIAQHSRMGILNKPFSPEQLAARVRECLDTPA